MRRWGRITALNGENATVSFSIACNACSGDVCALSWNGRKESELVVPRRAGWKVGQKVAVAAEPGRLMRMALIGYGLPLLGFWLGLLLGMPGGELLSAALALVGLLVALGLSRRYDAHRQLCAIQQQN